jgi:hypothetical protein
MLMNCWSSILMPILDAVEIRGSVTVEKNEIRLAEKATVHARAPVRSDVSSYLLLSVS